MSYSNAVRQLSLVDQLSEQEQNAKLAQVLRLWKPTDNCEENFADLIDLGARLCQIVFKGQVSWHDASWNISGFESTVSVRSVAHKSNILFTQRSGLQKFQKQKKSDERPFAEPFASFAKALVVVAHAHKPTSHNVHMVMMRAMRYLYEVAELHGCSHIHDLSPGLFDEALKLAVAQKEQETTLYVTGEKLSYIADKIMEFGLSVMPLNWENPIPRDYKHGGRLQTRNGPAQAKQRAEKLPKTAVLVFISALWTHYEELEERDKALTCMAMILMVCGFLLNCTQK